MQWNIIWAMKSGEVPTHATVEMGLEDTMLIEIRQTQKVRCCMIPLTQNLQNKHNHRDMKQISDLWGWGIGSHSQCVQSFSLGW